MAPAEGAKGTVLALLVEILAAVLTGANPSHQVSSYFTADGPPPGSGQFLIAIKPDNLDAFAERLDAVLDLVAGLEGARLPGDRRARSIQLASEQGISVPAQYLDLARNLARADT